MCYTDCMKKDINYPMIALILMTIFIVIGAIFVIVAEVNDTNELKTSGISAEVPVVEKYDKLEPVGKVWYTRYYIKIELPNDKITKERIEKREYNDLEVGDTLNVCYHNNISRVNFENCAN